MLIDFTVENFRSIKKMQTLTMSASKLVSKYKEVDSNNLILGPRKISLLKSKAIYGANASGKSNIIKALISFISIVTDSVKDDSILSKQIEPFSLSTETENEPSFFQISFILNNIKYRYGFEATQKEIKSEWLFGTPGKKEVEFFTRLERSINVNESKFKQGLVFSKIYQDTNEGLANNKSLFLTVVKSLYNGIASEIIEYLSNYIIISGLFSDYTMHKNAGDSIADENKRLKISELLKISDVGIEDVNRVEYQSKKNTNDFYITTKHKKFDINQKEKGFVNFLMFSGESEGSKKMFEIGPYILEAINEKRVLIIDEFDARFHPLLTKKVVELFNSTDNKESQFIFATHDTNLLNAKLLRRDQIYFVEKDKYGASHFYTLVDFKGIRNDSSFEKDYIAGKYGAIPFLGDFSLIIGD